MYTDLEHRAAGAHGPDAFDMLVADADEPVVKVHGRVAVPRDEPDLFAEHEAMIAADIEPAMLVGRPRVSYAVAARDQRHAGIDAQRLEAGVDDRAVRRRRAHDGGEQEQRVLEFGNGFAVAIEVASIVRVHEHIGPDLELVVDAALDLELEGAGAGAGDDPALQSVPPQQLERFGNLRGRARDRTAALLAPTQVLGGPV